MTMDENPDEVFEAEPEPEAEREENSDEQSNRSFRMMMIGLFAFGGLGVLLIALILIGRQGDRAAIDAQNQMVQATNTAIAMLAQITPTPPPTETPVPTNTATPPKPPAPTATPAPKDLVDTALSAGNFTTLSALLKTAGLVDALKEPGPFTIFAPTDDAFKQLSPETLDALSKDAKKLEMLLRYHVMEGALKVADVANLAEAKTLEGQPVVVVVEGGKTQVNDATVTKPDLETANGVIHTIDRVLVPPELSKEIVFVAPATPEPGATQAAAQGTPAAGKGTAMAQVQGTAAANATAKPATGGQATTVVATRVPPQAATATAAASLGVTGTLPISGTAGTGDTGLPTTGAGDNLFVLLLAAVGLVGVLVVARRLRTSQS